MEAEMKELLESYVLNAMRSRAASCGTVYYKKEADGTEQAKAIKRLVDKGIIKDIGKDCYQL